MAKILTSKAPQCLRGGGAFIFLSPLLEIREGAKKILKKAMLTKP